MKHHILTKHNQSDLNEKDLELEQLTSKTNRLKDKEEIKSDLYSQAISLDLMKHKRVNNETWENIVKLEMVAPFLKTLAIEGAPQSNHEAV